MSEHLPSTFEVAGVLYHQFKSTSRTGCSSRACIGKESIAVELDSAGTYPSYGNDRAPTAIPGSLGPSFFHFLSLRYNILPWRILLSRTAMAQLHGSVMTRYGSNYRD